MTGVATAVAVQVSCDGDQYVSEIAGAAASSRVFGEGSTVDAHPTSDVPSHSQTGCMTRVRGVPSRPVVATTA